MNPNQPTPQPPIVPKQPQDEGSLHQSGQEPGVLVTPPTVEQSSTPPSDVTMAAHAVVGELQIDSIESPQQQRKKKGARVAIIAVSVVAVLGVLGASGYYVYSLPKKSDYVAAQQLNAEIESIGQEMATQESSVTESLTEEEARTALAKTDESLTKIDQKVQELKVHHVMKDPDVAAAYMALADKYAKAKLVAAEIKEAYPLMINLRAECRKMAEADAQAKLRTAASNREVPALFNETTQACLDAASSLKGVKLSVVATYASSVEAALIAMRADVQELADAKTVAAQTAAREKLKEDQAKITAAGEVSAQEFAALKSYSVGEELAALKGALEKAQRRATL